MSFRQAALETGGAYFSRKYAPVHFFPAVALFHHRWIGANLRFTSPTEKASGSKASPNQTCGRSATGGRSRTCCQHGAVSGFPRHGRPRLLGDPAVARSAARAPGQPSPFPQDLPFELGEDCEQSGHRSTGRGGQVRSFSQRNEPDAQMLEFLKRCQQVRDRPAPNDAPPPIPCASNSTNAAGSAPSLRVLRPTGCDSVVSRLSLPNSRVSTLAVRNTTCSLAAPAASSHKPCGIGRRPVCDFRHRAKRPCIPRMPSGTSAAALRIASPPIAPAGRRPTVAITDSSRHACLLKAHNRRDGLGGAKAVRRHTLRSAVSCPDRPGAYSV